MVTSTQMRPTPRCDILCVLVIESTQHMQGLFQGLYDAVITRLITQMRTPIVVEPAGKKSQTATKATPCVRLGVVFYGDYFPYSSQTCSTQFFTSNYREFAKTIKAHRFCEGGQLRCAATEGLVAALEMFDDFAEFDPEAHLTNVQQRHAIMVTSTPPYAEGCRENTHMRYDGFGLDDVAQRMREMNISFSLIKERGKRIEEIEGLVKAANISSKEPLELPKSLSPNFDIQLMGIDLKLPPEFDKPVSSAVLNPATTLAHIQPQPPAPVSIQPQPLQSPQQQQQQVVPQKNKADSLVSPVDVPSVAKRPKLESQPTSVSIASPGSEESNKPARGKGKGKGGKKNARSSNSPAVAPKQMPAIAAAQAILQNTASIPQSQIPQAAAIAASSAAAVSNGTQQQQQRLGGQQMNSLSAQFLNVANNLKAQGITSMEDISKIFMFMTQMQDQKLTEEEKARIREQFQEALVKARQSSSNPVPQTQTPNVSAAAAASTAPQQPAAAPPNQATSPATQPAPLTGNVINQMLQHIVNAISNKYNADIRQIFTTLTPETFEASARELCRAQPEIITNLPIIKATFAQMKSLHVAQSLKQQKHRQLLKRQQQQPV
ncbi:hypothetical protein LPJ79_002532 [Coemansia sp. RSA 1821]|nr:hypothetical protein LPJ79_002532 [Coemansia sp. RSA 1821]